MTETVALPPVGDGSRRNRRRPQPPRRQRPPRGPLPLRQLLLGVAAVAVAIAVVAGALWFIGRDDREDEPPPAVRSVAGPRATTLLLERDDAGNLVGATVLAASRSGGGALLYVPAGTMLETPGLGLVPLADAARDSDDLARVTLENLVGVRFDRAAGVDRAAWTAAVSPAGRLTVRVPAAVERDGETVFPAGPAAVAPEAVADLLALPAANDLQRMVRHQAFWMAWLAAITADPDMAPPGSTFGGAGPDLARLAGGQVSHVVLPVTALGGDAELYKVETDGLDTALARVLPAPAWESRITVQVLNGTGRPGTAAAVTPALVAAGARVSITRNADRRDYATTQVVYYEEGAADAAAKVQRALGVGQVVRSSAGIGAVQVTVVVGADFGASSRGTPSTTEGAAP